MGLLWTYAYLSAHGYVLAHGGRLPCTCTTSAMWPPPLEDLPTLLGLKLWSDAWPAAWCRWKQVPTITPFRSRSCSSLCLWFLSWFLQRYLPPSPFVEHASCPSGRYLGPHCSSSSIVFTWDHMADSPYGSSHVNILNLLIPNVVTLLH